MMGSAAASVALYQRGCETSWRIGGIARHDVGDAAAGTAGGHCKPVAAWEEAGARLERQRARHRLCWAGE